MHGLTYREQSGYYGSSLRYGSMEPETFPASSDTFFGGRQRI
jgi:hypothetical protein